MLDADTIHLATKFTFILFSLLTTLRIQQKKNYIKQTIILASTYEQWYQRPASESRLLIYFDFMLEKIQNIFKKKK